MDKYHVGEKKLLKRDEKRGGNAYFSPIDLKFTNLQTKRLIFFRLRHARPHCNKYPLGKKYESRKGGGATKLISHLIYTPGIMMLWCLHIMQGIFKTYLQGWGAA